MFNEELKYTETEKKYYVENAVYENNKIIFEMFKEHVEDLIRESLTEFRKTLEPGFRFEIKSSIKQSE